ncbi:colanic acid biosynthesis pyruvyl transferase WcaK, partial [Salmonella enterica]|nr:colanic acid biosynthesis pyruvyl transferase WcaK [Salmonella enterica]
HSVGPFQNPDFNQLANYVFGRTSALILRETVSRDLMTAAQIDTRKVEQGVDTAWLVERRHDEFVASYAVQHWLDVTARRKTVAITLRDLEPFDKRLGTTQQVYEQAFAQVVNRLIADGYQVLALSTCTSIDRYNRDDRMVALRMAKYVNDSEHFHI